MLSCWNVALCSQLVRVMVSPVNSPGATASCQKSMYQCGLLQQLCTILMATGVPADILTEVMTGALTNTKKDCCLLGRLSEFKRVLWFLSCRPSTLYQRSSEAHRSTRTTLPLSTLLQTHRGEIQRENQDVKSPVTTWFCTRTNFFFLLHVFTDQPSWCCSCPWLMRDNRLCSAVQSSTVSSVSYTKIRKARERLSQRCCPPPSMVSYTMMRI